jgi:predicted short-subunit dehydrogenase-like oxidoreductase (DUF2520 family)
LKISIIGSGNIATFFAVRFFKSGHIIHQIISENVQRASVLAAQVNAQVVVNLSGLDDSVDALIVAIPDDEIKTIAIKSSATIIHCSGTCTLEDVQAMSKNLGCIWPIYSITKSDLPVHQNIPIIINYNMPIAKNIVEELANCLSKQVHFLSDEQKKIAHLTATISNNFSNHLFTIAHQICKNNDIPFELLTPILELTINKLQTSTPSQNQTGPALRHDVSTMEAHLTLLQDNEKWQKLYRLMSELIMEFHLK